MEQERSNCLVGRKVNEKGAYCVGLVFGTAASSLIVAAYNGFDLNFSLIVFVFVVNVVTTVVWLVGSRCSKNGLKLISLISWGTLLDIWLGYVILKSMHNVPYGPDLHYKYPTAEIVLPSITVFFVFIFILLILIYKNMGKDVRKLFEFSWKTYGIISGWLLIALSIGQTLLFYSQRSQSDFFYYGTIAYVVLNTIGAITFLYGFVKNKPMFVLAALVCWVIPLSIWIGLIIYGITEKGYNPGTRKTGQNPIYGMSIFYVILYVAICLEFKSIMSNESESERFNVAYAPPPTRKLDV